MTTDRLVFLHGFTQTHHHWHAAAHAIAARLDGTPRLTFVDLPGHGLSAADRTAIDDAGAPLATLAGAGTYVGYSMGGRFALVAALARPDLVERLVLIGATPGIADAAERQARRDADAALAGRLEAGGVEAFVDQWLALPMFAGLPPDPAGRGHRVRNTVAGLAHSLRECGTGSQAPRWDALGSLTAPVLLITGERDGTFTDVARRMHDLLPNAEHTVIAGAGHATHTERPDATTAAIATWLTRTRHR